MAIYLPPIPNNPITDVFVWRDWFFKVSQVLGEQAGIAWTSINFTGSNLRDIVTRQHNALQDLQGGIGSEYYHLSQAQYNTIASFPTVPFSIANGGTGQTTATNAINALLPSQTSNAGKVLSTDGTNTSWTTSSSGTVTSVGGTGTVSGISLSGTVTSSGNLTLGGTLDLSSPPTIGNVTPNTGAFTSVTTPSVTATTNDLTLSAISTGNLNLNTAGGTGLRVSDVASSVRYVTFNGAGASGSPGFFASAGSLAQSGGANSNISFYTNLFAQEQMRISHTASAVNYVQVTGNTTNNNPTISAQGSDANPSLWLTAKGSGQVVSRSWFTAAQASANYWQMAGAGAGTAPIISTLGSDTNIPIAFQTKGTGAIDLAAGSRGVNISNGGTVTAITKTSNGSGYTSFPSIAITAPTTAGGVQAVGSISTMIINNFPTAIASGGTGYTVGDVITLVGGTPSSVAGTFTVATVSGGVITSIGSSSNFATYTALPAKPVSVTGGTGPGATITATWVVGTIGDATPGSGYVEQPTITFSGGGGVTQATAYANIGSSTIIRGLASTSQFHLPSGETFRLSESGGTAVAGLNITNGSSSQNTVYLSPYGTAANPNLYLASKGTGNIIFATNTNNTSTGTQQAQMSHTASAVNYVQVTGAVTGGQPTISAQGSDGNIPLQFNSKGNQAFNFYTNTGTQRQFRIVHTTSSVNFGYVTGSATGTAVQFGVDALSTDADIDLALVPKGTGVVKFGTYTGTILTPTGYITIKDSGGTTRRLLVG